MYRYALTICQPYASLIALPDSDKRAKRCENRTWQHNYRGPILIHAGKGRDYLTPSTPDDSIDVYGFRISKLPFGAVIAVAEIAAVYQLDMAAPFSQRIPADALTRFPWLADHEHAEGPFINVLTNVQALPTPVSCNGRQMLWIPSQELLDAVQDEIRKI